MSERSDPLWGGSAEYEKPEDDSAARKLIRDYEHQTEIIRNQTELLAMMLKGMRQ